MKLTLRARLALSFLGVILIGMGIITPVAWYAVENLSLQTQTENLKAQAELIAAALNGSEAAAPSPGVYSQTSNVQPGIHTRIIDAQGGAVIDVSGIGVADGNMTTGAVNLPGLAQNATGVVSSAELLTRPEIALARQGKTAFAVRRVIQQGNKPVLYMAAPVISPQGQVTQLVYLAAPVADTRWTALPWGIKAQFIGLAGAAVLGAGVSGWWFARRITLPLERLKTAAERVASGDLDYEVPENDAIPDLAVLGHSFNQMTGSLRQADQAKNAFIADVSHELRTPLTVLKGSIETLQDGAVDDLAARDDFLASMGRETDRLIRLVNDLLILTRSDAGMLKLALEPVDLHQLACDRINALSSIATRRQVNLLLAAGGLAEVDDCQVMADADRMAQVLDNLLDNAMRYSPMGKEVVVLVARIDDQVKVEVSDSGPGIAGQHLPFIFDRFYRVEGSRDRSHGGSGLGLAIVRSLVQAHGGDVAIRSTEGNGTTLSFWLPACHKT